jgi:hypothetical protein
MPKRGKDKKKKRRRSKEIASSSGRGGTLLVGKQGLNVPRVTVILAGGIDPHTHRHLPTAAEDGFLDLGHTLPNIDQASPSQAWRDEKDWESLDRDLMQENEEDLMASVSQAAASINRAESTSLTNVGQSSPMTGSRGPCMQHA